MKRIIKEPRRLVAILLIVYIIVAVSFIADSFSTKISGKDITGLSSNGFVSIRIQSACSIPLVSGYNFVSICSNLTNSSVRSVLSTIDGQYSFVLKWNRDTQEFITYSPEAASNDFDTIEQNESYFIFMDNGATLSIIGADTEDMNISLGQEFNGPGYPYRFSTNISKYVVPISSDVSFVLIWNSSTQEFMTFSPEASQQEVERINIGNGQMIYAMNPVLLKYNKTLLQT